MRNEAALRAEVSQAVDAMNREIEASLDDPRATFELRFYRARKSPRPCEWHVLKNGVIVASSQPHLVGRRRSA